MPISGGELRVGVTGNIYIAASGTSGPANMAAAWTSFTDLGYTTEDGPTFSRSLSVERIPAWQTVATVRYVVTGVELTLGFALMQWNETTLPLWLGGGTVVAQGGGSYKYSISSTPSIDERVLGIQWIDGTINYRLVLGRCMVTDSGESNLVKSAPATLPMTFSAMSPTSGSELGYLLTDDPAMA